tara:strand:+ start:186 stop:1157 length:972 start_codon:yes stop_codon:yes gene_type:complete
MSKVILKVDVREGVSYIGLRPGGFMRLTVAEKTAFENQGYLLVEGALTDDDIYPVINEYERYIDARAKELYRDKKISSLFEDQPFERRLAYICKEFGDIYHEMDIMYFRGKECFTFLSNENLIDLVEGLVGPEITCSPIQHIRPKLPEGITPTGADSHIVPWHQDAGVTWEEADPYFILTVWLPLAESTCENGCLEIVPCVHGDGLWEHSSKPGAGTSIADKLMPEAEPVLLPMKKGDVLLMHKEIPHRSGRNHSNDIRWSMDLRYQATGTPTGRPFHPEFVVRSAMNPESVLTDYDVWCHKWKEALKESSTSGVRAHRWEAG